MDNSSLYEIANSLLVKGKGLLAADESEKTMFSHFKDVNITENYEMQRRYRELLFTTPDIEKYLSGVIMYDTSMRDTTKEGIPFPDVLASRGIIPGIKVDGGLVPLDGFAGETVGIGLDTLPKRLAEYYDQGARFTKWRAAFTIDANTPSDTTITANAFMLARYAALVQAAHMVPIIEPEVIFHGIHSLARAEEVTMRVLQLTFATMREFRIDLKGLILKSSMVLASDGYAEQTLPQEVADATLRTFHLSVPHEVPGIVFLSGGQTPKRATENLQAITKMGTQPWKTTFSYSRAIEEPVLAAWRGDEVNVLKAQGVLQERCRLNSFASLGTYNAMDDIA